MVCRWEGGGGVEKWGYECSVNGGGDECSAKGGDGKDFCQNFLQPFLEKFNRKSCNDGSRELIPVFQPSPKMPTLSFVGGSLLGVP